MVSLPDRAYLLIGLLMKVWQFFEDLFKTLWNWISSQNFFDDYRQKCSQIRYDFKGSWFYLKAYIGQTTLKLLICFGLITWSITGQCHGLRESFQTNFRCRVFDYEHECSIPSNGMNMIIFDIVNFVLGLIICVAGYSINWHWQFRGSHHGGIYSFYDDIIRPETAPNIWKNPYGYLKSKVRPKDFFWK